MPSLVAEIGAAIEAHMLTIGMIAPPEPVHHAAIPAAEGESESDEAYPDNAELCAKCYTKAVVSVSGCLTCLSCGDSKCA